MRSIPGAVRRALRLRGSDRGVAMLSVVYVTVALTAIATTVVVVSRDDVIASSADRQSTAALATADAGVAQAMEFIRLNGVGTLTCLEAASSPPSGACAVAPTTLAQQWASPVSPRQVRVDGTAGGCDPGIACYEVWISALQAYDPPVVKTGSYRIHSTGFFGGGPGAKSLVVDVDVAATQFPIGVFAEQLDGNGGTRIYSESLFTRDCVSPRHTGSGNGTRFQGYDEYWGQPAAANTTNVISSANNCGASGQIHRTSVCVTGTGGALVHDRDSQGGPVPAGSPCASWSIPGHPAGTRTTTKFTVADLESYGYRPGGLSDAEYDALKVKASSMGLYNPAGSLQAKIQAVVASGVNNPVLFVDTGDLTLKSSDIPAALGRLPNTTCSPASLVVVVRHGDLTYQGGNSAWRTMAVFVPEGDFTGNGGYNIIGTLFANNVSLGGNEQWQLDDCFVDNMPGPLMTLDVTGFREDDRSDVP